MSIKILIDSACDIVKAEAQKLGITLIPMEITFADKTYYDGFDLSHDKFYELLSESKEIPQTSQINEYRFEEAFTKLTADGSEVLCITMSSKLSGTCERAKHSAQKFDGKVAVVDSYNVAIGERILLDYAIRLVKDGLSLQEVKKELDDKKHKIQLVAYVDSLKYLYKGGRLTATSTAVGTILNIKPIVEMGEGVVKVVGKVLGIKKAFSLIYEKMEKLGKIDFTKPFAVGYSGVDDSNLVRFVEELKEKFVEFKNVCKYQIGSTIGTHIGDGCVGIAYFSK